MDAIVAYLRTQVLGATITDVSLPLVWMLRTATTDPAEQMLRGETIEAIDRRGKHVLFLLRRSSLVINPMLVGRFYYQDPEARPPRQTVIALRLSTGKTLRYADER